MNKILIASVAILGFAGVAAAQQAPALYGTNYSASVLDTQADASTFTGSASATASTGRGAGVDGSVNINQLENYSGK